MNQQRLYDFLHARLRETEVALLSQRDGHPGPCLNFAGQKQEEYDEHDSCYLHIENARSSPYSDTAFGLVQVAAMRDVVIIHRAVRRTDFVHPDGSSAGSLEVCHACDANSTDADWPDSPCQTLCHLALPYQPHPDYRQEWRP